MLDAEEDKSKAPELEVIEYDNEEMIEELNIQGRYRFFGQHIQTIPNKNELLSPARNKLEEIQKCLDNNKQLQRIIQLGVNGSSIADVLYIGHLLKKRFEEDSMGREFRIGTMMDVIRKGITNRFSILETNLYNMNRLSSTLKNRNRNRGFKIIEIETETLETLKPKLEDPESENGTPLDITWSSTIDNTE
uniref:Uncharacterized protein n=1 Tax=Romanomermis culicivorax TaxID=13658 RepID=A0A915HR53_ROMCU